MNRHLCLLLTPVLLLPALLLFPWLGMLADEGRMRRDAKIGDVGAGSTTHRHIASTEMDGRTIHQVERVEVGVELASDTSTLQPSTE